MALSSPRSVLIVVENLPVPVDRRVWMEATTLRQAGYTVSVIGPMGCGCFKAYEEIDGVHVYRYPEPREAKAGVIAYAREYVHALWHMFRLARRVRRERGFDVIHGCNPPDILFLLAWRYRIAGVRYLFDHHDVCPELFDAKFGRRGWVRLVLLLCERLSFATADVSLATNESFKRIAVERGKMAPEDVFVVRSAPRVEQFVPAEGARAYRRGAKTVFGYVGVIGQQEGMDLLVAAAESLVATRGKRDVHFLIIGFGPMLDTVKQDVQARGLSDYFTFPGPLFGDKMVEALNAVDVGLAPDPRNAMNDISTMNKVIEYMALAKPVVQFDLTEGRASAGPASLYARNNDPVDFARKLERLVDRPEEIDALGALGRKRVLEQLSWRHSVPHLLAAYDRIFAGVEARRSRTRTGSRGATLAHHAKPVAVLPRAVAELGRSVDRP